jgi:uncharacterized protein
MVKELEKPGRDPRDPFKVFQFRDDIFEVKDLKEGMICPGLVTNVTNFGAFVDIGVHQDGLVHISELAHKFVDDPRKVVNPGDQVTVKVLKVDQAKNQISLSMKLEAAPDHKSFRDQKDNRPERPRGDFKGKGQPDNRGRDNKFSPKGPSQKFEPSNSRGGSSGGPAKPGNPFNNPFAALLNQGHNKK